MPDVSHDWGEDLQVSATGDLALVDGLTLGEQRVMRRLCTNPGEYIWNTAYGAGLPGKVGATLDEMAIVSAIRSQLYQEASVARSPTPQIKATANGLGVFSVTVAYVDAGSGQQASVAFDITP